ncbi:hypothetical protein LZ30DRAFT_603416 [Colletotrichum cereale]|nr:hypothetical protein LZ30DRAFT_603416 [Colletotrichum cereale]
MQFSYLCTTLLLVVGVTAQRCSGRIIYCPNSGCDCFPPGIKETLNQDCIKMGFQRSLGPSKTTVGSDSHCDHQCCTG